MRGSTTSLLKTMAHDLQRSWRNLALTEITYKIISFIVLVPLVGILFRGMLSLSGHAVLADQDILFFFISPPGLICLIILGSLWLGIAMLEQAALMAILYAKQRDTQWFGVRDVLMFAVRNAMAVIQVTGRVIVYSLLTLTPFLIIAGLVYSILLTDYDINFYLKEIPPAFIAAICIGGILGITLIAVFLKLLTDWFFVLPLVLFEDVSPANAFKKSRRKVVGHRRNLVLWVMSWNFASFVLSGLISILVIFLGQLLIPSAAGSLWLLILSIGGMILLWSGISLALNILKMMTLAAMQFHLYQQWGAEKEMGSNLVFHIEESSVGFQLTRSRLIVGGVIGSVFALITGFLVIQSLPLEDQVDVTAHRGSSKAAPENTMASIKKAIEERADWVEIDVQETADGEVVVFHDSDFMKSSGVNLKIWDATMADLKTIDVGSRFSPNFKDERVPTLGEVLMECKGKVGVNIELKYYGHDEQLEQKVVDIVEAHGMELEIVVMSLKIDAIRKMKSLRPDWTVGLLMSVSAGDLQNVNVDFLAVNAGFASWDVIQSTQASGKKVYVWTVNDVATMSTMISRGANNLITDYPALARTVIEQRAQMNPLERLLLVFGGVFGMVPESDAI